MKGDLTLVSLGNYLNPRLLTEVNSVLSHQYCHDRDSTDRDSTEFHTENLILMTYNRMQGENFACLFLLLLS